MLNGLNQQHKIFPFWIQMLDRFMNVLWWSIDWCISTKGVLSHRVGAPRKEFSFNPRWFLVPFLYFWLFYFYAFSVNRKRFSNDEKLMSSFLITQLILCIIRFLSVICGYPHLKQLFRRHKNSFPTSSWNLIINSKYAVKQTDFLEFFRSL
jgi:hypothetical protein